MSKAIEGLKPEGVWKFFAEISLIPRGSKNEAAISKYVSDQARKFGLEVETDKVGNVVARKPGSKGCENLRWSACRATSTWSAKKTRRRSTTS